MTFGEKLRELRLDRGYTQTELAELTGLGLDTISNYEIGRTHPKNPNTYVLLARVLNVEPGELHNDNDEFVEAVHAQYGLHGRKQAEKLIENMRSLFAGGELTEQEKDGVMRALQDAYWECKQQNVDKYTPRKYKG